MALATVPSSAPSGAGSSIASAPDLLQDQLEVWQLLQHPPGDLAPRIFQDGHAVHYGSWGLLVNLKTVQGGGLLRRWL
jgi:hypothetical protein